MALGEVHINGRFLAAPRTGVQRVASELVEALDHLSGDGDIRFRLIHPEGVSRPVLRNISSEALAGPRGALWEQIALTRRSRGHVLLNLANTAPIAHSRSVVMIHDAQIYETPDSYSQAFRIWYRVLLPMIARRALTLLTVSEHSARRLDYFGVRNARGARVVPNGLDHILRIAPDDSVFERLSLTAKPYVLGFASAQVHKNVGFLVALFGDPSLAACDLALVGDKLPPGVEATPNVRLLGRIEDAALRALCEGAVCFAFPSLTEGFGLPPGEAMLCGAPAILSDVGAMNEVYRDGAWFAPPNDRAAWLAAIRAMIDDPAQRAARAARGQACAQRLSWDAAGRRLLEIVTAVSETRRF